MLSKVKLKKELKSLRQLIETTTDPILSCIAYAMETAVRYATEDGLVDWESLVDEAKTEAELMRKELAQ